MPSEQNSEISASVGGVGTVCTAAPAYAVGVAEDGDAVLPPSNTLRFLDAADEDEDALAAGALEPAPPLAAFEDDNDAGCGVCDASAAVNPCPLSLGSLFSCTRANTRTMFGWRKPISAAATAANVDSSATNDDADDDDGDDDDEAIVALAEAVAVLAFEAVDFAFDAFAAARAVDALVAD